MMKTKTEAELVRLPEDDDGEENDEMPEESDVVEPEGTFRELVLRWSTIKVLVLATQEMLIMTQPEGFHPANVAELLEQLRKKLQVPQAEPYTTVRREEYANID
uniref:Uncharacterized protein n=1 Tax=Setaria digitata TaxID=48799 RepID=A0A915Q427_9BILA